MTADAPPDRPRFGVIGTGLMAASMMRTFARAGIPVVAVASRDGARARRFGKAFAVPDADGTLDRLLERRDVEAVYIANATVDHEATALAALEAGKAVLCEKPLALDAAGAARVAAAARRANRLCMEGLWTLFLPGHLRFLSLAEAGACGVPGHLCAEFGSAESATDRLLEPAAGGVLLDRSGYLLALALKALGPVERIDAQVALSPAGIDHHACLQLGHRAGGHSQLALSFKVQLANRARLSGPAGSLELGDRLPAAEWLALRRAGLPRTVRMEAASDPRGRLAGRLRTVPLLRRLHRSLPSGATEHLTYGPDPYLPEVRHFLHLLRTGAGESDVVPLALSLDILRIIDRARAVARSRTPPFEGRSRENRLPDELLPDDEHHVHPAGDRGARTARA
ncbi:Gfo/Idh/MocA family protein [Methylorubrum salsuginis]|uniref:Predicted dehydrogenase n=1 Tax=Methylorubrum salsuginis TaxID=414703 RepID=A0A1I4LR62_9HYPH|nr:Gfo/Idh/MocA family oxidoreductase [Methylorubrum salsuginis]SFL93500.1 Predicted dehydrogenase [Methylorubrum salsuginis]